MSFPNDEFSVFTNHFFESFVLRCWAAFGRKRGKSSNVILKLTKPEIF